MTRVEPLTVLLGVDRSTRVDVLGDLPPARRRAVMDAAAEHGAMVTDEGEEALRLDTDPWSADAVLAAITAITPARCWRGVEGVGAAWERCRTVPGQVWAGPAITIHYPAQDYGTSARIDVLADADLIVRVLDQIPESKDWHWPIMTSSLPPATGAVTILGLDAVNEVDVDRRIHWMLTGSKIREFVYRPRAVVEVLQ